MRGRLPSRLLVSSISLPRSDWITEGSEPVWAPARGLHLCQPWGALRGWACAFPPCPAPGQSAAQKAGREGPSGLIHHTAAQVTQRLETGHGSIGLWACSSGLPRRPYRRLPKPKDLATRSPWLETPRQPPPLMEQVHQELLSTSRYVWGSGERHLPRQRLWDPHPKP